MRSREKKLLVERRLGKAKLGGCHPLGVPGRLSFLPGILSGAVFIILDVRPRFL